MKWRSSLIKFFVFSLALVLVACAEKEAADPPAKTAFAVSVVVTKIDGTVGELNITLAIGGDTSTITTKIDGLHSFDTLLANTAGFSLNIKNPDDKICKFDNTDDFQTSGVINKRDLAFTVTCTDVPKFSLGGSTTGLISTTVTLSTEVTRNSTVVDIPNFDINANGDFTLANTLFEGDEYVVTIVTQQGGEICTISNGSGTIGTANINNISIDCTTIPTFSLGGTTTGLINTTLSLSTNITRSNASVNIPNYDINSIEDFTLSNNLREGDEYVVTIASQQGDEICTLNNGRGTVATANISNIAIVCLPKIEPVFNIGGMASNIDTDTTGVTLKLNGGNDKILSTNGTFNFGTPVPNGTYTITLQDPGFPTQICTFANGTKSTDITISDADNTSLALSCVTQTFAISGNISALASNSLIITNSVNNEQASLVGNPATSFDFATNVKDGSYNLNIQNPSNPIQSCRFVSNGRRNLSISVAGGNVSNVAINCVTQQFSVLANVNVADITSITGTLGLELVANGSQVATLDINSNTTPIPTPFSVPLDDSTEFTVNISSQPVDATCSFPNSQASDTKTLSGADATSNIISCVATPRFAITGVVDGLIGNDAIDLQIDNPTTDTATASGDVPNYSFNNLLDGNTYNVTITPLPTDYDCSFPGSVATAAVTVNGGDIPAPTITCRQTLNVLAFTDTNLSNCLAVDVAGPPVKTYVDEITVLSCGGAGVADLTGIDKLFNLVTLNLPDNGIADISALAGLNNLSILDLSNNLLTDTVLPILEALSGLTDLNLGNDVSLVNQNAVTQVPNIAGLTTLNLNNNTPATPALDLTNLGALGGLLELRVDGNSLADLASFAGVTQLTTLSISGNALADIIGLAGITDLQTLLLMNNTVAMTNLSSLGGGGLPNIASIDLTGNAATLCSEVEGLKTALGIQGIVISQSPVAGSDCAGPPPTTEFLVSGQIVTTAGTGLTASSTGLVLQLNGVSDPVVPAIDGAVTSFAFSTPLPIGATYTVTVFTQPSDPVEDIFCAVDAATGSGTGTVDVTNVTVDCSTVPEVAAVAAFNTAQGVTGDIFNQCLINQTPIPRVSLVGEGNALTNPLVGVTESRTVDCSGTNITDLSGIQYLDAVTVLNIANLIQ